MDKDQEPVSINYLTISSATLASGTEAGVQQDMERRRRAKIMGKPRGDRGEYFSNRYYNLISFGFAPR